ncbi:hypothetical protein AVEN_222372-1 [Araneus ventricosus]|uniref:Uncharacterized protein n=1 Tax=Araneus ventricosus TaxID=182803 RepID=A0A4Y2EHG0_ARAVE|nr:hypothetical protein AVEN_222372-1 [Araneus ventricosus]
MINECALLYYVPMNELSWTGTDGCQQMKWMVVGSVESPDRGGTFFLQQIADEELPGKMGCKTAAGNTLCLKEGSILALLWRIIGLGIRGMHAQEAISLTTGKLRSLYKTRAVVLGPDYQKTRILEEVQVKLYTEFYIGDEQSQSPYKTGTEGLDFLNYGLYSIRGTKTPGRFERMSLFSAYLETLWWERVLKNNISRTKIRQLKPLILGKGCSPFAKRW